jgi:zinc protease
MRDAGMFTVIAIANQGIAIDTVHAQLLHQVAASAEAITTEELDKARNTWRAGTVLSRPRALAVSEAVHYAAMYLGSPEAINTDARRYEAVTVADLRRVALRYLTPENSFTLLIVPEGR